jgi:hypothetical protein
MTSVARLFLLASFVAPLLGCGVEVGSIPKDNPRNKVSGYDFVAHTSSGSNNLTLPMPRLMRAALRHCALPNTVSARESIRHSGVYGLYFDRFMDFACPVPSKDMK